MKPPKSPFSAIPPLRNLPRGLVVAEDLDADARRLSLLLRGAGGADAHQDILLTSVASGIETGHFMA